MVDMIDVEIGFKSIGRQRVEKFLSGATGSEYFASSGKLGLVYHNHFDAFINDIDHETLHHIVFQLEGEHASQTIDNTSLQLEFAVGYKDRNEFVEFLLRNCPEYHKKRVLTLIKIIEALP